MRMPTSAARGFCLLALLCIGTPAHAGDAASGPLRAAAAAPQTALPPAPYTDLGRYAENNAATLVVRYPDGIASSAVALTTSGYVLTACHVIDADSSWTVEYQTTVNGVSKTVSLKPEFVAASRKYDIAVLKVKEALPDAVRLAPPSMLMAGMPIYTIGFPLTYGRSVVDGTVTNTDPILSTPGGQRYYPGKMFGMDMHITHGNSGGGVYDKRYGLLVGYADTVSIQFIPPPGPRLPPIAYQIGTAVGGETIIPWLEQHHVPYLDWSGREKTYAGKPPTLAELQKTDPTEGPLPPGPTMPLVIPSPLKLPPHPAPLPKTEPPKK